jgi:hypothetical protein
MTPELSDKDKIRFEFSARVGACVNNPKRQEQLVEYIQRLNSAYSPIGEIGKMDSRQVLLNLVAGIYGPMICAFADAISKNVRKRLPPNLIFLPRDAYPILSAFLEICKDPSFCRPLVLHFNREETLQKDPLLKEYLTQMIGEMKREDNGLRITEVDTGVFGTVSKLLAKALKDVAPDIESYVPVKFFGLGHGVSFVHAVHNRYGSKDSNRIGGFKQVCDTMEGIGLGKLHSKVKKFKMSSNGKVIPTIEDFSDGGVGEFAKDSNRVISELARNPENSRIGVQMILRFEELLNEKNLPLAYCAPLPPSNNVGIDDFESFVKGVEFEI